jgi:hypothetical protein
MIFVDVGLDAMKEKVLVMETLLVNPVQISMVRDKMILDV